MSSLVRSPAAWLCGAATATALLPFAAPQAAWLHAGAYGSGLGLLAATLGTLLWRAHYGVAPRRDAARSIALAGGMLLAVAATICALLDAETRRLEGAPGRRVALPGSDATVVFPAEPAVAPDALALEIATPHGAASLREDERRIFGRSLVRLDAIPAATLAARRRDGTRLTLTRPEGGFLAPILLFRGGVAIAGATLPTDALAVPALDRRVVGFHVDATTARTARFAHLTGGRAGVLLDVQGRDGGPAAGGIGFAAEGSPATVGDAVFVVRPGRYPDVLIASVPQPGLVALGLCGVAGGGAAAIIRGRRRRA